jgi:CHAD domain-containing protein
VVELNDPMPLAGIAVMREHWKDATRREPGVRAGEDPLAVHDARVAIRRLRAAFTLFDRWYPKRDLRGFRSELRRLGRALGTVRDREVLLTNARAAASQLPDGELYGLLAQWEEEHADARVRLLRHLDGKRFRRFRRRFEKFLARHGAAATAEASSPDDGGAKLQEPEVAPKLVCDIMPAEIWKRYGAVHAYAPFVGEASLQRLHRLRIAGKRLRYAIESFQGGLAGSVKEVTAPLRDMQDALGELHDADVTIELLQVFQAGKAGPTDRVEPYLDQQRARLLESRARFETLWPAVAGAAFRAQLAGAIAGVHSPRQ